MQILEQLYNIAFAEIGQKEIEGNEHNLRILEYHKATSLGAGTDEVAWCSSFINWCVKQTGLKGTNSAAARSWLKWGKEISEPITGCIVVLKRGNNPKQGHVGLYVKSENGTNKIRVLGGNQSDCVNVQFYNKNDVLSCRVPNE